jgi:hypothetical protein
MLCEGGCWVSFVRASVRNSSPLSLRFLISDLLCRGKRFDRAERRAYSGAMVCVRAWDEKTGAEMGEKRNAVEID